MPLREFFERAAIIARREGLPFTARDKSLSVPVDNIRRYLMLDSDKLKQKQLFDYRITFGLRVNLNSRPGITVGFESNPGSSITLRFNHEFGSPLDEADEEHIAASQAIIMTDYKKAIARRGFAVMIHERITNVEVLPMVFGIHGTYNKDEQLCVRRLAVPTFDNKGFVTGLQNIAVTKDNIELALTYAKLCAAQIYNKEQMTPFMNWDKAVRVCKEPSPAESQPNPK